MDNPVAAWVSFQRSWLDALGSNLFSTRETTDSNDLLKAWQKAMGIASMPTWTPLPSLDHAMGVFGAYNKLYEAWTQAAGAGSQGDTSANTNKIFMAWREIVDDLAKRMAGMFTFGASELTQKMGLDAPAFVEQVLSSVDSYQDFYRDFYKPWQDSMAKLSRRLVEATGSELSPDAVDKFHEAWTEAYEETLGRFVKIPNVGPSRQRHELFLKMVDAMYRWQGSNMEFSIQLQLPGRKAFEAIADKLPKLTTPEATKDDFYEFYDSLIGELEKQTLQFFKSERFTSAMQSTLLASLELYQLMQKLMEDQLKATPIITRSEMDEVEAELVALKRKVRKQERELRGLKAEKPTRRNEG